MRWYEQACWQVGPRVDEWTLTELTRGRASPLPCQVVRDMTLSQLLRWPMIIELGVLVALPPIEKDGILAELPTTEVCLSMKKMVDTSDICSWKSCQYQLPIREICVGSLREKQLPCHCSTRTRACQPAHIEMGRWWGRSSGQQAL